MRFALWDFAGPASVFKQGPALFQEASSQWLNKEVKQGPSPLCPVRHSSDRQPLLWRAQLHWQRLLGWYDSLMPSSGLACSFLFSWKLLLPVKLLQFCSILVSTSLGTHLAEFFTYVKSGIWKDGMYGYSTVKGTENNICIMCISTCNTYYLNVHLNI